MKKLIGIILAAILSLQLGAKVFAECPADCSSCWNQCTTADNCGSGHKCIETKCGNRCVKE